MFLLVTHPSHLLIVRLLNKQNNYVMIYGGKLSHSKNLDFLYLLHKKGITASNCYIDNR